MATGEAARGGGLSSAMRLILLAAAFAAGAWLQARGDLTAFFSHWGDIVYLTRQHIQLAAIASGLALLIGLPLGIVLTRPWAAAFADIVLQVVNLGTTIPTLALLALAMSVLGIGAPPAIFALVVLTILPIVLNTVAGLKSVPWHLIDAGLGMGMTRSQILMRIELPNAVFVILAGVRTAFAICIGTVPLAFLIGGGGLGELIFTGIDVDEPSMLFAGAIPTALLVIVADFVIGQIQFWLVPKGVNPLR